jgi:hypothetical protein
VAGKPAIVWCADSDTSWKTFLATRYGAPSETSMSDEPREERLERIERDAAFGIAFTEDTLWLVAEIRRLASPEPSDNRARRDEPAARRAFSLLPERSGTSTGQPDNLASS